MSVKLKSSNSIPDMRCMTVKCKNFVLKISWKFKYVLDKSNGYLKQVFYVVNFFLVYQK